MTGTISIYLSAAMSEGYRFSIKFCRSIEHSTLSLRRRIGSQTGFDGAIEPNELLYQRIEKIERP
jgi:hypothetical protein